MIGQITGAELWAELLAHTCADGQVRQKEKKKRVRECFFHGGPIRRSRGWLAPPTHCFWRCHSTCPSWCSGWSGRWLQNTSTNVSVCCCQQWGHGWLWCEKDAVVVAAEWKRAIWNLPDPQTTKTKRARSQGPTGDFSSLTGRCEQTWEQVNYIR